MPGGGADAAEAPEHAAPESHEHHGLFHGLVDKIEERVEEALVEAAGEALEMISGSHANVAPAFATEIVLGTSGEEVRSWQERMVELGMAISVTGTYDDESEACCRSFQSDRSLHVTGVVDYATWEATFNG